MLNDVRVERLLRQLNDCCDAPPLAANPLESIMSLVSEAVPVDATCWATFDPATTLPTSCVSRSLEASAESWERFLHLEYVDPARFAFRSLREERCPAAVLGEHEASTGEADRRHAMHLSPLGFGHEMRALFFDEHGAWGGAGFFRAKGRAFTTEEKDVMVRIGPLVAGAIRKSVVRAGAKSSGAPEGPAVLIFDGADLEEATPAARDWLELLATLDRGDTGLPLSVRAVARRAQAGTAVSQRIRLPSGHLVLKGAKLSSRRAIVTIERPRPPEVIALVSAALGLSPRERDVVEGVLGGLSTRDLARALHLSPYTVQDHLKVIFEKARVSSRRELVARVFFDFHAEPLISAAKTNEGS